MAFTPYNHNATYFPIGPNYLVYTSGGTYVTPYLAFGSLFVSANGLSHNIPDPQGAILYPKISYNAGTAGIYTVTVSNATVGATYFVSLSYKTSNLGYTPPISVQYTAVVGDTTTTIATALTALLNGYTGTAVSSLSSSAVITLTERAVGQLVTVLASGNCVVATSTASVVPFGDNASMLACGVAPGDFTSTVHYDAYVFNFGVLRDAGIPNQGRVSEGRTIWVFVDNSLSAVETAIAGAIAGTDTASLYLSVSTS